MFATRTALLALAALTLATPALSQPEKLDKYSLERWGGTWRADCKDTTGARVEVREEALVFVHKGKRVTATNFRIASSWFGNSPPPGFETALLADQPNDKQFLAFLWKDDTGEYIQLDGDPEILTQIGKPSLALKYRQCGVKSAAPAKAAAPAPATDAPKEGAPAPATSEEPDAHAMMVDPAFRAAYEKALGKYASEEWLATLDGPSGPSKKVKVAKNEYRLVSSCKNHDCYDNNVVLLYSSAKNVVYGKVVVKSTHGLLGNPPPAVSKELEALWRSEFRSNPE